MLGTTLTELILIRLCIHGFQLITPLCIAYLLICAASQKLLLPLWITAYAALETGFLVFVYLPRKRMLQKPAQHPEILDRPGRAALFHRCCTEISMAETYVGWFHSADSSSIGRDIVRQWILWALFSCHPEDAEEEWDDEIEEHIRELENIVGKKFEAGGHKNARSWRPTLDPVQMLHRPFVWYMIVALVDTITSVYLLRLGFNHHNSMPFFSAFPPRPLATFLSHRSPVPEMSFWYRPHQSCTKLPIVFIHGIGIGLWPYTPFLHDVITQDPDIGIILIELLPVSMHITHPPFSRSESCTFIHRILSSIPIKRQIENEGIPSNNEANRFVLASHSYGTVISTHLLHSPLTSPMISSALLIDPIPFLIHLPDVAFNFMYRQPKTANEWQLWYFASRDPDISRALGRYFFWAENIMWKDDLQKEGKKFAVLLSGRDQIVSHSEMVRNYLTGDDEPKPYWRSPKGELEVIWKEGLDHAMVFDTKERRRQMVEVLGRFVRGGGKDEVKLQ